MNASHKPGKCVAAMLAGHNIHLRFHLGGSIVYAITASN